MTGVSPTLRTEAEAAVMRAQAYILSRQSAPGGFCFYRSGPVDEPNLRDTYHAVAALTLLGAMVPAADRIVDFVCGRRTFDSGFLYWYAFTLDRLGCADAIDATRRARIRDLTIDVPKPGQVDMAQRLTRALRAARLLSRFGQLPEGRGVRDALDALKLGGGYGTEPNLTDTSRALGIRHCFGALMDSDDTRAFVDRMQVPPFGFALTENARTGTLEVIHAGVRCCALLGLPLRRSGEVLRFVLACQTKDGGFAPAPVALPDLAQTHRALVVIRSLVSGHSGTAMPAVPP